MNTAKPTRSVTAVRILITVVALAALFLVGLAAGYYMTPSADVAATAGTLSPFDRAETEVPISRPDLTEDLNSPIPDTSSPSSDAMTAEPDTAPATTTPAVTEPTDDPVKDDKPRPTYPVTDRKLVVCVDPGHGYDDPGTVSPYIDGLYEKSINLKVALLVEQKLSDSGFEVIMTRRDDVVPAGMKPTNGMYLFNPYAREEFLRAQEVVDLFVSIHCNAIEGDTLTGTEIYYYEQNNALTPAYVQAVADGILNATGRQSYTRGYAYDDAYYVTKCTHIPSVLVEMGYLSNEAETQLLLSDAFCDKMAQGIADGICAFARAQMQ